MTRREQTGFVRNVEWKILGMLPIVATVDLVSNKPKKTMSDMSGSKLNKNQVDESDFGELWEYHRQKLQQEAAEATDQKPIYLRWNAAIRGGAALALWLIGVIVGIALLPAEAGLVLGGGIGGTIGLSITQTGTVLKRTFIDFDPDNQEQQQSSSSKPKKICPNCGWRNPKDNNYCHDCGSELDSG